jgi:tRNA G18 (ribose-2'-O)-methylase SpoU
VLSKRAMPSVFLHAPQDFHNLCLLVRTLEAFGHRRCFLFDPHHVVRERYGKVRSRELRATSAGAFDKMTWVRVEQPAEHLSQHRGRVIATVAAPNATSLCEHRFEPDDLLVFGSESCGLPPELVSQSDAALTIPLLGETRSLNLAVSLGIVLFEMHRQLTAISDDPREIQNAHRDFGKSPHR